MNLISHKTGMFSTKKKQDSFESSLFWELQDNWINKCSLFSISFRCQFKDNKLNNTLDTVGLLKFMQQRIALTI